MNMRLLNSLIVYMIPTLVILLANGEGTLHYGFLIRSVYNKYDCAGVILVSDMSSQSFVKATTVFEILQEMSARNILSVVITFLELKERVESYRQKTSCLLVAVFIDALDDVEDFRKLNRDMNFDDITWMLLFTGNNDEESRTFCHNSIGNPFDMEFNSVALVSCHESGNIEGWWSIEKINTNGVILDKRINGDNRTKWSSNVSLDNRLKSLNECTFRAAIVKGSALVWREEKQFHGYSGEILTELLTIMNCSISTTIEVSASGSFYSDTGLWSGIIGALLQDEADIGVSEIIRTKERQEVVDFTIDIAIGKTALFIRKPVDIVVPWEVYIKAFHSNIWLTIIILLLTTPILLTITRYQRKYNLFNVICEDYLNVWCIFCQHGFSEFPKEARLRIIHISIFASAMVVFAAYSASLVSNLATITPYQPFHTMEEFVNDNSYKLIVIRDGADYQMFMTSENTLLKNMASLMKPNSDLPATLEEGFKQVCNEKVAFYTNEVLKNSNFKFDCELSHVVSGHIQSLGMIMQRHNKYTKIMNNHLHRFRMHGLMKRLRQKYFVNSTSLENIYDPVEIHDITSILLISAVLFFIAVVIFVIEKWFHQFEERVRIMSRKNLLKRLLRKVKLSNRMSWQ